LGGASNSCVLVHACILRPGGLFMSVEFREWNGLRRTFFAGASEPVWLMAKVARTAAGPRNNLQTTIPPP